MTVKLSELKCKEVICIADGRRLGFVSDVQLRMPEGAVQCIIVPGPGRFLGLWGRKEDYVIPWCNIQRIGPDIILVDIEPDRCCTPRFKPGWLG